MLIQVLWFSDHALIKNLRFFSVPFISLGLSAQLKAQINLMLLYNLFE